MVFSYPLNLIFFSWLTKPIPVSRLSISREITLPNSAHNLYSSIINKRITKISDNFLREELCIFLLNKNSLFKIFQALNLLWTNLQVKKQNKKKHHFYLLKLLQSFIYETNVADVTYNFLLSGSCILASF